MITEEVFLWQIQWAGTWMVTRTRFTENGIRREHPEAVRVEDSRQVRLTPESPQERLHAASRNMSRTPDVHYQLHRRP
jgi:hypothetical protein